MRFTVSRRPDPSIDITPMIDVVFQLVLFFMVSTTFVSTPGFEVDLPRSTAQVVMNDNRDVNIWMTAEDAVYINDEPVDLKGLRQRLRRVASEDPDTLVVVRADEEVSHGRVVQVMDVARGEGLTRLAIATEAGQAVEREEQ